jgi:flagellum-specific peptidoglycan hydrolase FlgJ
MQEDYEKAISDYLAFLEHNAAYASALYNIACSLSASMWSFTASNQGTR